MLNITEFLDQNSHLEPSRMARELLRCYPNSITSIEVIHQARLGGFCFCASPSKVKRAYRELLTFCQAKEAKALSDSLGDK